MNARSLSIPAALVALSAIPVTIGVLRLLQLAGGPAVIPSDARFTGFPAALVLHIVAATVYALVGAFQFVPRLRRRHSGWHRTAGRVLAGAGVLVAGSALWLAVFYAPQPGTGDLLYVLRLFFGTAMAASLVLGVSAIRKGDIPAHRAWMIRAYAIGLAAGTQAFTSGIGESLFGTGEIRGDLAKAAGWVINLAVAELVIRRSGRRAQQPPPQSCFIRLDGHLDDHWSGRLGGLTISHNGDGTSTLAGPVADQAQLHGVLAGLRDIGAVLLELRWDDCATHQSVRR